MGVITIIANGLELDFVKETLSIKKENNAFIQDFKVSHSSFPFLILENEKTKQALGTRDMASVIKNKTVPVTVIELGERFYGELEILGYPTGYRKCNIKFGTELLKILNKKLSDLLPVVSVIPEEENPVPFTEEAIETIPGYEYWINYPTGFAGKIYPEVKYQFPVMAWPKKFGEDPPEEGDEWYGYGGYYNQFNTIPAYFKVNTLDISGEQGQIITINNTNVPSPQLFLLAIFEYAFANAGYKITGPFVTNELARRLLVLSTKTNLCKINVAPETQYIDFTDLSYDGVLLFYDRFIYNIVAEAAGTYTFTYYIHEPLRPGGITSQNHHSQLKYDFDGSGYNVYYNINDPEHLIFEGTFEVQVTEEQVGQTIKLSWIRWYESSGDPVQFLIHWTNESKPFNMMHPTIPLGRYAPDWTLSDALNEVKNKFCLDIIFDNLAKKVHFNFASDLISGSAQHISNKSLSIKEYNTPDFSAFILKNQDESDNFIYLDREGVILNQDSESDLVGRIESQFMLVPNNGFTADLSGIEDKNGTGLMIYDPQGLDGFELPVIVPSYGGYTLSWEGGLGIYNIFHKKALRFRLNASSLEIEGPFTEIEISKMNQLQRIYLDHQAYVIYSMEYSETRNANYLVKLRLGSINL